MDLPSFIKSVGDEAAARLFGVKLRTVASWKYGERTPHGKRAAEIERLTKGKVRVTEIYAGNGQ
jgi:DNA-binding transcriptional regulator YdaS (Cro superfamily)